MARKKKKIIPVHQAFAWVFLSTVLVSGSAIAALQYYKHVRGKRFHDEKYNIVAIVQSTSGNEAVKTVYLAELMELSVDKPVNLFQFDSDEAQKKILNQQIQNQITEKLRNTSIIQ